MTARQLFWSGRRVVVTGHTGFKGTWLCSWLAGLGAKVTGIALPPATEPSLFALSDLGGRIDSRILDVRSRERLRQALAEVEPEIVFHLAAQPLVLTSLQDPVATFQTNIQGVVNLLDAARLLPDLRAIVVVTSDKCYLCPDRRCRESDPLGGHDPYSASKACAEIVVEAYRSCSFPPEQGIGLATARAGNVIGGGDFSPGRLLPDLVRAFAAGQPSCAIPVPCARGNTCWTRSRATCSSPSASSPSLRPTPRPGTSAPTRTRPGRRRASPTLQRSASARAPGATSRATWRSRYRRSCSIPSGRSIGSAGGRGSRRPRPWPGPSTATARCCRTATRAGSTGRSRPTRSARPRRR